MIFGDEDELGVRIGIPDYFLNSLELKVIESGYFLLEFFYNVCTCFFKGNLTEAELSFLLFLGKHASFEETKSIGFGNL